MYEVIYEFDFKGFRVSILKDPRGGLFLRIGNGDKFIPLKPNNGEYTLSNEGIKLLLSEVLKHELNEGDVAYLYARLKRPEIQATVLKTVEEEAKKPLSLDELADVLGLTIKRDYENKLLTFLCMLSAYTDQDQFNISFRAESSTGKSYIPLEIAQLFPQEDIKLIAYASPTAFFHETAQRDEESGKFIVDLERKILIFVDMPHDELLRRLRPLLSHDRKELEYKITDKTGKGKLRTKNVIVRGFPSVIFCTGHLKVEDQEATRLILLSPDIDQEKLREAIYLKAFREGNREAFHTWLESDPRRELLKRRILAIKCEGIKDIIIPNPQMVADLFLDGKKVLKPRYSRDIGRILSIAKAIALLNLWHRERKGGSIVASEEDIEEAFRIYEKIAEAQELGIAPYVYRIYQDVLIPLWKANGWNGVSRTEIAKAYFKTYGRVLEDWRLRNEILPSLNAAGLITEEPDPNDKRRKLVCPTTPERGHTPQVISIESDHHETKTNVIQRIRELYEQGETIRGIARKLDLAYSKVWRTIQEFKKGDSKVIDSIEIKGGRDLPPKGTVKESTKEGDHEKDSHVVRLERVDGDAICELCGRPGASYKLIFDDGHAEIVHRSCALESYPELQSMKLLSCPYCTAKFASEKDLQAHIQAEHGGEA